MKLCARNENGDECVYAAFEKMVGKMKQGVADRQNIVYSGQIVVARIYELSAAALSEACRRKFEVKRADCEPAKQFKKKNVTLDVFILLNQLKEDGFITDEYKQTIFAALIDIDPDIGKLVEGSQAEGLI